MQIQHFQFNALIDECCDTARELHFVADEREQHAYSKYRDAMTLGLRSQNNFGT